MKLHLPKALVAALMASMMAAGNTYAVDDTDMTWANHGGVYRWTGSGWQLGTLIAGHEITDWEDGYTWSDASGTGRDNSKGPILLIDGTTGNTTGNTDTSDNGGVVAINGANANINLGGWGGYIYVEEGSSLSAYLVTKNTNQGKELKSMDANAYSLVANGNLTFTSTVKFDVNSQNQKWHIGSAGSVTFNDAFTVNKPLSLEIEVHGNSLKGQTVANRLENRVVLTTTNDLSGNSSITITYKDDITGNTLTGYPTALSATGLTAGFTKETLVWKGGAGKTWRNGADGWYIQGDADQTATGFINGDNVVINTADTVTLGGDITFGNMTANAAATVTAGSNKLYGGTVTATNGILTIQGGETHFNKLTTTGTGVIKLQNGYFAGTAAEGDVLTINGNVDLGGNNLSARHGATINIEGGTVSTTRFIAHAANDYGRNDTINIKGGIVNVKKDDTTNNNLEQSGIIAGHWHTMTIGDANANHMITVDGGVLNAAKANLLVSWDSRAYFNVNSGEANVNKLIIGGQTNARAAKVYLRGGRLNIGSGGITTVQTSVSERLVISGGTLGTLTESEISTAAPISITTSGSFIIDTQVHSINESKESDVTDGAGSITINGVISGNGAMEKTGAGILKLNGANSSYSGTITVNKGTLIANHADALGTGAITVGANGTLEYAVDCTLAATNTYTGTVQLDNGVTATLDGAVSVGALALGGDACVSLDVSGDISLAATTVTLNNHTLTLDFGTPTVSYTSDTTISNLVTGLSGAASGLDIVFAGSSAELKAGETNVWQAMLGRSTYEWSLDNAGALSLYVKTGRAMTLVWNGASTEWNQVSDNANWNMESDVARAVCFENGDSVRFSESATATLDGAITANVLRVDDGATVSLSSKTDIDTDSLTVTDLRLGSAKAEGAAATPGTQSLTLNALNTTTGTVTVEEGKTASLTLAQGATLTVNDEILANKAATLTVDGAVASVSSITAAAGTETENGGSVTITGAVTGSDLAINAGAKGSITLQGNVTGISSITAGKNASVSITGNTAGTFTTLTAGEGGGISLTGATIRPGGNLTINGNVTIGDSAGTSTLTAAGSLTIASGTTVIKAYREGTSTNHNITINAGATLDVREGVLWRDNQYVEQGTMTVNGKLIVKNLRYYSAGVHGQNSMGAFHNNAQYFLFGNGATVEVVEGSGFASGAKDGQGFKLNGTAANNTYTLVFDEGARSKMTMEGGLQAVSGKNHKLVFDVKQNAEVRFAYDVSSAMTGADAPTINRLTTLTKTGAGEMTIFNALSDLSGNFTGTLQVEGGKLTIAATLTPSTISVSNGTLAFGEGGSTTGTVDVAAGATLAYADGTHSIENLTFANGAVLDATKGTATLNQALDVKRTVTSGANTGNVHIGDGTNKGTLALGANGSLTYDGATYAAKTGSTESSIASTEGKELSLSYSGQTFKGLDITLKSVGTGGDNPREINAVLEDVNLKLDGSRAAFTTSREVDTLTLENNSTFYAKGATAEIASATIGAGSEIKSMTQNAAWVGDPEYTISTTSANGGTLKKVTLGSAAVAGATSGEGADIRALGEMNSLTLDAAASMSISNVTLKDSTINATKDATRHTISYGEHVVAIATTATQKPSENMDGRIAKGLVLAGEGEEFSGETSADLTANTVVQKGGTATGSLTVDIADTLLTVGDPGRSLEWTILQDVQLGTVGEDGKHFALLFGDTLQYLIDNGQRVSLKISGAESSTTFDGAKVAANVDNFTTDSGVLADWYGQSATIILTVENIPEPTTGVLSVLALAALAARRRRK